MYRLATEKDLPDIYKALEKLAGKVASTGQGLVKPAPKKALRSVRTVVSSKKAYIVDSYLVFTEVISPWYSNDRLLQEWFVLRLYQGGNVTSVPLALRGIAKELNCSVVITADSSPVNLVGKAYAEAGYKELTRSFYERVDYGIRTASDR